MTYFSRLMISSLLLLCLAVVAFAQDSLQNWANVNFAEESLEAADIAYLELQELKLLRGLVFGRHGRIFKDVAINKSSQSALVPAKSGVQEFFA